MEHHDELRRLKEIEEDAQDDLAPRTKKVTKPVQIVKQVVEIYPELRHKPQLLKELKVCFLIHADERMVRLIWKNFVRGWMSHWKGLRLF